MKTKNFIPTLLALVIRVMVTGQTQETQYRILNLLGGKQPSSPSMGVAKSQTLKEKSAAVQKDKSAHPAATTKVYPHLVNTQEAMATNNTVIDNNTFNYYTNPNCYSTPIYAAELLKQAEELISIEELFRKHSRTLSPAEKENVLAAAGKLLQQAQYKQIQASEIIGETALKTFTKNKILFLSFIAKANDNITAPLAESMEAEAEYSMKQAKEMREEAYSQPTNAAKLGTMSNAEEKEKEALAQQTQALLLIKKSLASQVSIISDMVVK